MIKRDPKKFKLQLKSISTEIINSSKLTEFQQENSNSLYYILRPLNQYS